MLFVGLTGSVATGKSTVSNIFKKLGCYVIDADELAHRVYEKNQPAYREIVNEFGKRILDENGSIDRKKLRDIVLKDRDLLKKLECITHPEVEKLRDEELNRIKKKDKNAIVVYDVPLLFEKNLENAFDYTIVVYADREIEIERLMKRSNISKNEALKMISLQIPIEDKKKRGDFVVDNSKDMEYTKKQVEKIYEQLKLMVNKHTQ